MNRLLYSLLVISTSVVSLIRCDPGASLTLAACESEPVAITIQRQKNFDTTLRPLLLKDGNRCIECHDGKSKRAPFSHSSPDLALAYGAATSLVDLINPSASPIVVKTQKGHNCGSAPECNALGAAMTSAILSWADSESSLPPQPQCNKNLTSGLSLVLEGKLIKASTLSKTAATVLRWDVTELSTEFVGKVNFSIDVFHYVDTTTVANGSFKLNRPVLATDTQRLKVVSIIPLLNGRLTKYANYGDVDFVVGQMSFDPTASIWGFRPLSTAQQVADYIDVANGDALGFQILLKDATDEQPSVTTPTPGCKSDKFQAVYDNVLNLKVLIDGNYVGQCTRCHGDPNQAANAVMDLSYNGTDACLNVLTRVKLKDAYKSLLLTKPSHADATGCQGTPHPVKISFLKDCNNNPADASKNAELAQILNWIDAEDKAQ